MGYWLMAQFFRHLINNFRASNNPLKHISIFNCTYNYYPYNFCTFTKNYQNENLCSRLTL